jgi:arylsulfatase A-like enzyme
MLILLYVLDALRPDHLGCFGYPRNTSTHIDQLAQDGVVFEKCFSSSTWTRPVAASLLTGAYPAIHGARTRYDWFSTGLLRLPEVLQEKGYKTAAFSTMGNIGSDIGFDRGFDQYFDLYRDLAILAKRQRLDPTEAGLLHASEGESVALPRAEDVNDALFPWLEKNGEQNAFCFLWSIETHVPYTAPEQFRKFSGPAPLPPKAGTQEDIRQAGAADRDRLIDLYDNEIYYNDACIGEMIAKLKSLGVYNDTMLIIMSDHGDAFFEHGVYAHGHTPFEELIHVPLIIKFPHSQYAGRRVEHLVELIDLFPTIARVADAPIPPENSCVQGCDLISLLDTDSSERKYVFSDTQMVDVHNRYYSVRDQHWKYIKIESAERNRGTFLDTLKYILKRRLLLKILKSPRHYLRNYMGQSNKFLFDLQSDPTESVNLISEKSDIANQMQQILADWRKRNEALAGKVAALPKDIVGYEESEILTRHLKKLGYLE